MQDPVCSQDLVDSVLIRSKRFKVRAAFKAFAFPNFSVLSSVSQ